MSLGKGRVAVNGSESTVHSQLRSPNSCAASQLLGGDTGPQKELIVLQYLLMEEEFRGLGTQNLFMGSI